jgi:REP element-mobilizing transposase RayT
MSTYNEKELACEQSFKEYGPFAHLYTDGTKMENIFCSREDKILVMTAIAVERMLSEDVMIITFEVMKNHLHFIMSGTEDACLGFFARLKRRLMRMFSQTDKVVDWSNFQASVLPINNLMSLRNEIIYVNRNAFVADPDYTPYSYPWGGGCAYFNELMQMLPVCNIEELSITKRRELAKCRDVSKLGGLEFVGNIPYIPSFCRIDIGEKMFRDARSYFHALTRNAEAFSQIASRLKDVVFLTEDELFSVAVKRSKEAFSESKPALLQPEQKIQLARELHFKYNASNQQLRRLLKLDIKILSELFPE